jgi:membrane protease YdiL (CAAX protease family)
VLTEPTAATSSQRTERSRAEDIAEIWLVFCVCVGIFFSVSLSYLFRTGTQPIPLTVERFAGTLGFEAILALAFVPFLRTRGWTLARVTRPWQFRDLVRGAGLFLFLYVVYYLIAWLVHAIGPQFAAGVTTRHFTGTLPWSMIVLGSLLNPIFEEFLYLGYGVTALHRYGVTLAVIVSVTLRVAVHLYQGWAALLYIAPTGIILTLYYVRSNRLWPAIIAHAALDAVALASLGQGLSPSVHG